MDFELWLALVATSAALLAVPGPVVMMLFGYTAKYGRSVAGAAIAGVVAGDFVAMTISLLGAGAILSASANLFLVLKLMGASYLIWLGLQMWRSEVKMLETTPNLAAKQKLTIVRHTFLVTALNPKDIVFFVAFLPQFLTPTHSTWPQIAVIEITFLSLVVMSTSIWILFADTLVWRFKETKQLRFMNRVGGSCLVAAGTLTALTR